MSGFSEETRWRADAIRNQILEEIIFRDTDKSPAREEFLRAAKEYREAVTAWLKAKGVIP